jgi:serine/threonine protein kinase
MLCVACADVVLTRGAARIASAADAHAAAPASCWEHPCPAALHDALEELRVFDPPKTRFTPDDLLELRQHVLGSGRYGVVSRCEHNTMGFIAVKHFDVRLNVSNAHDSATRRASFCTELSALLALERVAPGVAGWWPVVRLKGAMLEEDELALILEYVAGKDLRFVLNSPLRLADDAPHMLTLTAFPAVASGPCRHLVSVLVDVAAGCAYMHAASLAHRDLKPENVLLDTLAFYDGALLRAKVVDFGSAVRTRDPDATVVSGEMHPGTELYRPPEAPQRAVADADAPAGDVWAFGLIVFELIQCATNQDGQQPAGVPVHDIDAVRFQLQRWKDETLGLQRKLSELAMECLQQAAAERPTFKVVEDSLRALQR